MLSVYVDFKALLLRLYWVEPFLKNCKARLHSTISEISNVDILLAKLLAGIN